MALQFFTLFVGLLVLFVPGGLLLWALGWKQWLSPYLVPAAELTVGLATMSVFTAITLVLHLPIAWIVAGQALVALGGLVMGRVLERPDPLEYLWKINPIAWALAIATGLTTVIVGGALRGDALYHAGLAVKLEALRHPSLASTSQFRDGGFNPGYWLPAWHETIAVVAHIAGSSVATVMWVLPALTAGCIVLTAAGLAHVAFRSHVAAVLGAAAYVASQIVMTAPQFIPGSQGAYPRTIVTEIVLPLAVACWIVSLWHERHESRRGALYLMLVCLGVTLALHSNYVFFFGLGIAGYLLVWALRGPWPKYMVKRHAGRAVAVAIVGLGGIAALIPLLATNDRFARGTGASKTEVVFQQWGQILVGHTGAYHLRADYLVWYGGLALLGLLCIPLAMLLIRREPAAWLLIGLTPLVIGISQSNHIFPILVGSGNASQFVRLHLALPVALGLTLGLLLAGSLLDVMWERSRISAVIATAIVAIKLGWFAQHFPMRGDTEHPSIAQWPIKLVLALLVVAIVVLAVQLIRRVRRAPSAQLAADNAFVTLDAQHESAIPVAKPGAVALAVTLVVGTLPATAPAAIDLRHALSGRPTHAEAIVGIKPTPFKTKHFGLRHAVVKPIVPGFDRPIVRGLRNLKARTVVAARLEDSYELMAVAPLNVIASDPGHVATTSANRPLARLRTLSAFVLPGATDDARLRILQREHAGALLTPAWKSASLQRFAEAHPRVFREVARGRSLVLYRIDPSALRHAPSP